MDKLLSLTVKSELAMIVALSGAQITQVSKESAQAINEINAGISEIIASTQDVNAINRDFSEATDVLVEHMSRFKT